MTATSTTPGAVDAAERGTLRIEHRVVRKLAERAADAVEGTTVATRRVAGLGLGHHGAHVTVGGHGAALDLSLDVVLTYPTPIHEIVATLRAAVTQTVEHNTDYRVRALAVTVSALQSRTARVH